jgi:serine/threonine protein phosphatase 1
MARVYAIGDIHGRLDLFEAALSAIAARGGRRRVVCLGDYVDRGPQSAQLIGRLMALSGPDFICLKGNHEAMMIEALDAPRGRAMEAWRFNGGDATLDTYGGAERVPASHRAWLEALDLWWSDDHRYYVHAGVEPGLPMAAQDEAVLLWIRDRFLLASGETLPGHIVHGHTPRWRGKPEPSVPELLPQRTNLDTGAWLTGVLSVGVFDPDRAGGPLEVLAIR